MNSRRFTSWIFLGIIAIFVVGSAWYLWKKINPAPPAPSAADTSLSSPSATSSVEVPTSSLMQLSDPAQGTLPGTLVIDGSSTVISADGTWSASMEMIQEYPITYSFNDGNGPDLIVDDAYLLITNLKTGDKKEIGVLDLAPDKMIAAAKSAPAQAKYEYVTYDLAWTAGDQVTGRAELYNVSSGTPRELQAAQFTVNPATWTVKKASTAVSPSS
jgi:hypothetical protein